MPHRQVRMDAAQHWQQKERGMKTISTTITDLEPHLAGVELYFDDLNKALLC
jgi:hypothetical protein